MSKSASVGDGGGRRAHVQIPEHWEVLKIGEVFSRRVEHGRAGLPVMSITMTGGLVERDSVERRVDSNLPPEGHLLVRAGDLAYNMMRMWQGVLGRGRFDCLVSPAYVVLQPGEMIDPEFAEYLFSTGAAIAEFKRLSYGVVDDRLRLYYRDLVRIPFAVPRSREEQRRIAEVLSTLDETIAQTEALIAKSQQIKAGLMHDLCTRGVTPDGRLRPTCAEAPYLYEASPLGTIPKEWRTRTLKEMSQFITSGSRGWADYYSGTGPVFFRIGNLTRDHINFRWDSIVRVSLPDLTEGQRTSVMPNDILISITADLGMVAVADQGLGEAYVNQHIALVRPKCGRDLSRFIGRQIATDLVQRQFLRLNDSGAKAGLNLPAVGGIVIAMPYDEAEAKTITRVLDSADENIEAHRHELAKLRQRKIGLMHDLLTGRVRVKVRKSEEVPA